MSDWSHIAGRCLMIGLPGPELDAATVERIDRLAPGGVILFGRNLVTVDQTSSLLTTLAGRFDHPMLLALDQEGGRVSRLEPWIGPTPTAVDLARSGVEATRAFGAETARVLRGIGFNVDFAPVVDLCGADATNGIGDRSFGVDPERVAELAGAFLDGLQSAGVAGCLKHFPGLGPTDVDSHETLPTARRGADELERLDLVPYARLGPRAATVMVGHGHYPELDPRPNLPATLSRPIVTDWLRGRLGYDGLVVSDDLEMGAVAALDVDGAAAVAALDAGCDLVLYCKELERAERAADALSRRAERDAGFADRLRSAARAVDDAATRWSRGVDA